jgi:hypothetical protein
MRLLAELAKTPELNALGQQLRSIEMPSTASVAVDTAAAKRHEADARDRQHESGTGEPSTVDRTTGKQAREHRAAISHDDIATLAYYCWQARGCPEVPLRLTGSAPRKN